MSLRHLQLNEWEKTHLLGRLNPPAKGLELEVVEGLPPILECASPGVAGPVRSYVCPADPKTNMH